MAQRLRIDFLDGLRGLAAFYVMLGHAFTLATYENGVLNPSLSPNFVRLLHAFTQERAAVGVFIVLSGFCLMLPVLRNKRVLPGGLRGFALRRARRILPPYYVALLGVVGLVLVSHHLTPHGQNAADLSFGNLLSHFLLLHNLSLQYNMSLDGPMWSVAWEWQIYFIFALLLLPIWRRFGMVWTVGLGFGLGILPLLVLPAASNLAWMSPWYIGLFALGMAAADALTKPVHFLHNPRFQNRVLAVLAGAFLLTLAVRPLWLYNYSLIVDTGLGIFTALLILGCAHNAPGTGWRARVVGILESPGLMRLGAFSYSLYLVHYPILKKMQEVQNRHHISHYAQCLVMLAIGVPLSLGLAYLFHLAFERPFMPHHPRTIRQAERTALESPAP